MESLKYTAPKPHATMSAENTSLKHMAVKKPSNFEVFNACVNNLTGKDKLAKTLQYSLRFLAAVNEVHGLGNPQIARSVRSSQIVDEGDRETALAPDNGGKVWVDGTGRSGASASGKYMLGLLTRLFVKYTKVVSKTSLQRMVLLFLAFLTSKMSNLLNGLNVYRHLLRAGTIPFRVWKFTNHIRYSLEILLNRTDLDSPAVKMEKVLQYWTSKDMISQVANFWYAVSDELLLVYRFKLLLTKKDGGSEVSDALFAWAEDHELYSWMATILLGLNNDWNKWVSLREKKSRIILNEKVKARTKRIVGTLRRQKHRAGTPELCDFSNSTDELDDVSELNELDAVSKDRLAEIETQMTTVRINAVRLTCDLVFDAKYIFHWNMYKPLHVSLGLVSGCLGLVNVWRQQRDRLTNEALAAARSEELSQLQQQQTFKN